MSEQSAFDQNNIALRTIPQSSGLLEQFNLPPRLIFFIRSNQRALTLAALVLIAVAIGASVYDTYRSYRIDKAASALDAARIAEKDGRQRLEDVVREFGGTPSGVWAKIELARLDEKEGNAAAAIGRYEELRNSLADGLPLRPLVLIKLAGLYDKEKQWDQALAVYTTLSGIAGFEADAFKARGRISEEQGQSAQAVAMYEKYLELSKPKDGVGQADPARDMITSRLALLKK